jgi:glycosyltransferase involved in cell wall biosynthesis
MAQVLFVLEFPTPQRTPVLDAMADRGVDLLALVHRGQDAAHGWGMIEPRHSCATIPRSLIRSCQFVVRHVLAADVRVLCCFGYNRPANMVAVLAARLRGIQVVTRTDSNWTQELSRPRLRRLVKRIMLRLLYGRHTRVWTIGSQNDHYWTEMGLSNRHLIPFELPRPPIGTEEQGRAFRETHRLGPGLVVLYVGVLEPHKGVDTLVEAFRSVPGPLARLVIVGQGSLGRLVHEAATTDPRIVCCGPMPQQKLGPAFAAADLLVLPSRQEPWGYVVNEAQANGVRVVVSDAVGCAVDSVDDTNGAVFRAGDADELAELLAQAARDHARGPLGVPPRGAYDATPEFIADLIQLGVSLNPKHRARNTA